MMPEEADTASQMQQECSQDAYIAAGDLTLCSSLRSVLPVLSYLKPSITSHGFF